MKRISFSLFILLVAALTFVFPPISRAQGSGANIRITQVDNARFPQVTAYVSVTDASGEPLVVNPNRIRLYENGQPVEIRQVDSGEALGPLTTLLVMDVSGSMFDGGKLPAAQAAARAYVEQMRLGDEAGLLTFNTAVEYLQPLTADRRALERAIDSLDARGDTAMFDALLEGIQTLQAETGRKAIILLTDGLDNVSRHTQDETLQAAEDRGLSISTIGLGDPEKLGINAGLDEALLLSLAEQAGGVYGYADNASDLLDLYEKYGRALQSEYAITYTSPSALRDGVNRSLTASLDGATGDETRYNPGGVLPEVSRATNWLPFGLSMAVLVLLLFIPGILGMFKPRVRLKKDKNKPAAREGRVKLK